MIEKQSYKKNVFLRNTNQTFSCHIIKIHYVTISQFDIFPLHPILCIFLLFYFLPFHLIIFFFLIYFLLRYSCLPFCWHHVILNHFSYRYKYIYIVQFFGCRCHICLSILSRCIASYWSFSRLFLCALICLKCADWVQSDSIMFSMFKFKVYLEYNSIN